MLSSFRRLVGIVVLCLCVLWFYFFIFFCHPHRHHFIVVLYNIYIEFVVILYQCSA
jgi:hypothetical protein